MLGHLLACFPLQFKMTSFSDHVWHENRLSESHGSTLAGWLARLGYNVFNLLYFGLLHPGHAEDYANMLAEKSTEALAVFGLGLDADAQDSAAVAEMFQEQALWSLSPAGQAVDAVTALLWVSLVAGIVSAILRRTPGAEETLDA